MVSTTEPAMNSLAHPLQLPKATEAHPPPVSEVQTPQVPEVTEVHPPQLAEAQPPQVPEATEAQPPQVPGPIQITKTDPRTTAETTREPKRVPEAVNCEDQHEKCTGPHLTSQSRSYKAVSTVRFAIQLGSIILGNCLCSGCICLCLRSYSSINNLSQGEKRAFNTISLLLSASLGFSVGFLFDQIGLLARGTFLQRKCHSMEEVCADT